MPVNLIRNQRSCKVERRRKEEDDDDDNCEGKQRPVSNESSEFNNQMKKTIKTIREKGRERERKGEKGRERERKGEKGREREREKLSVLKEQHLGNT